MTGAFLDALGHANGTAGKRWTDPWPVKFLIGLLFMLWGGAAATAGNFYGRINETEKDSAVQFAELRGEIKSLNDRIEAESQARAREREDTRKSLERIEGKLDR